MSNRALLRKDLILIAGGALLLYALYQIYQIAVEPVSVVNGNRAGGYLLIEYSPSLVIIEAIEQSILFFVAAAAILFGLWSKQARKMYWCLQAAVWLVGLTLWFKASYHLDPFPVDAWGWFIGTAMVSLFLLALYRPLMHVLNRLLFAPLHEA